MNTFILEAQNERQMLINKNMYIEKYISELIFRGLLLIGIIIRLLNMKYYYLKNLTLATIIIVLFVSTLTNIYAISILIFNKKNNFNFIYLNQLLKFLFYYILVIFMTIYSFYLEINIESFILFIIFNIIMLPISGYFTSNYTKIALQILLFIYNIILTLRFYYSNFEHSYALIFTQLHSFHYVFQSIIYLNIINSSMKQKSEKNNLNFEAMHDLRNYIYSLEQIEEETKKIDNTYEIEVGNLSNNNESNDESFNGQELILNKKSNSLKFRNSDTVQYLEEDKYDYEKEKNRHRKFITYKVCFLYHLELIYDENYLIKPTEIDIIDCFTDIKELLGILFMYKNIKVNIEINSSIKTLSLDHVIFQYFINHMVKTLNDCFYDKVDIEFNMKRLPRKSIEINIKFKLDNMKIQLIDELEYSTVIGKLIKCLYKNIDYHLYYNNNSMIISLTVYDSNLNDNSQDYNLYNIDGDFKPKTDSTIIYKTKLKIKDNNLNLLNGDDLLKHRNAKINDTEIEYLSRKGTYDNRRQASLSVSDKSDENPIVISPNETSKGQLFQKYIEENTKYYYQIDEYNNLYVNCDDEENILRMNQKLLKKDNIELTCVRDRGQLLRLLACIWRDFQESFNEIKPRILILMDHMLDRDYGYKVVQDVQDFNRITQFDLSFALVSSTEDKETLDLYEGLGITEFIVKPLTKAKVKLLLHKFINNNIN